MINSSVLLDLDDITVVPSVTSSINSRSEIDIYYHKENVHSLPLITAPMDTVIDRNNEQLFLDNKINICLPRGEGYDHTSKTKALHLFYSVSVISN